MASILIFPFLWYTYTYAVMPFIKDIMKLMKEAETQSQLETETNQNTLFPIITQQ